MPILLIALHPVTARLKLISRAELARDLLMLSFYMCGMNAVDLYHLSHFRAGDKRLEYNRSKTSKVRKDDAFISIRIVPEAVPLLENISGALDPGKTEI